MPKQTYQLDISDTLGWWGFTKHDARRGLAAAPEGEVHVRLSSFGGSLADGLDIRRQFADHGNIIVHIVGMTASAATVLAMGARRIVMSRGASILIHNCSLWVDSWGTKNKEEVAEEVEKLRALHGDLSTLDGVMADIYAARTGKPVEEMAALMTANRWMGAEEALSLGLIDAIDDDLNTASKENASSALETIAALGLPTIEAQESTQPESSSSTSLLHTIIERIGALGQQVATAFAAPKSETQPHIFMNKTSHPALLAALGLEEITATADGAVTLTAAQLTALNERLATDAQAAADVAAQLAAEKQQTATLQARIEALEKADGDDTPDPIAPEAPEEMSVLALAKII